VSKHKGQKFIELVQ